jgi:N-acetyl-anhydromuramyl-L-alanine amidase AmpD
MPNSYGIMGLTLDGQNYFSNNLVAVSKLSGYTIDEIMSDPKKNILAYADAYVAVKKSLKITSNSIADQIAVLAVLSELPQKTTGQIFALNTQIYGYLKFLNSVNYQQLYGFPHYTIDFTAIFGAGNYAVLSSSSITVTHENIFNKSGQQFQPKSLQSTDYGPALWTASCNFSSRYGTAISAVAIHDVEGSYAGCISWFQNCNAQVSAHYVARSSDGQITQMVLESDEAWHVGSENLYTVGIEHEGYSNDATWYTTAMYTESAKLVCDICNSGYGINATDCWNGPACTGSSSQCQLSAAYRVKGHQHFPNQTHTDPGPNWDWPQYYNLVNSCGVSLPPTTLSVQQSSCPSIGVLLNWQNSGSGWYMDVTDDASWSYYWSKDVSGLSTVACPGGFCLSGSPCSNPSNFLQFQPNTTYYWRIWDGSSHTVGQSFTTPSCVLIDSINCSSVFNDSGGQLNAYSGNEDQVITFSPPNATNITVNFTSFDLENQSDFLYVHDGNSTAAAQISGSPFTGTTGPGNFTSSGPSLTFHFVSDPLVQNAGWEATYNCAALSTGITSHSNENNFNISPNPFIQYALVSYELNEATKVEIEIYDIMGKTIFHHDSEEQKGKHLLNIGENEQIAKGVYFVRFKINDGVLIKKLMKE